MRPNLTNMHKVMDRIEEITRKCSPRPERDTAQSGASRFVELLEAGESSKTGKNDKKKSGKSAGAAPVDALRRQVSRVAEDYNIDEELIRAVIQVESGWRSDAVSSKGAMGLMQLMPRTAEMLEVEDAFDPEQNIEGGVKYLARLTDKYEGDVEKALAAYNAGPSRVDGGRRPPETERYVKNVMALYHRYREEG
jgi:soluble lytic murein transglycosylase-like protein